MDADEASMAALRLRGNSGEEDELVGRGCTTAESGERSPPGSCHPDVPDVVRATSPPLCPPPLRSPGGAEEVTGHGQASEREARPGVAVLPQRLAVCLSRLSYCPRPPGPMETAI